MREIKMKPYKERLPLIDAAIDYFIPRHGGYPSKCQYMVEFNPKSHAWCATDCSDNYLFTQDEFNQRKAERQNKPKWADAPEWANWLAQDRDGKWGWYSNKPDCTNNYFWRFTVVDMGNRYGSALAIGEVIGNWQDTLEKRPEPKDQPMKYEYGVEYETNGEKPDLPDDVKVEVCDEKGKWWGRYKVAGLSWKTHSETVKFRIVDERYKPKEQDMNDWYEKGERPPVGSECEFKAISRCNSEDFASDWEVCRILYIGKNGGAVVKDKNGDECFIDELDYDLSFRPLPTETDKLVEQALNDINLTDVPVPPNITARDLIKAGYRKTKPMSEDEFVFEAHPMVKTREASNLYRAGCRFIDSGADK